MHQGVSGWCVSRLELHGQGAQAALAGAPERFAVLQQRAVQMQADVSLQAVGEALQHLWRARREGSLPVPGGNALTEQRDQRQHHQASIPPAPRKPKGEHLPILGSAQGQTGWGLEQPSLVEGVLAHSREWSSLSFEVSSNCKPLCDSMISVTF